jgi:hypothetical protein
MITDPALWMFLLGMIGLFIRNYRDFLSLTGSNEMMIDMAPVTPLFSKDWFERIHHLRHTLVAGETLWQGDFPPIAVIGSRIVIPVMFLIGVACILIFRYSPRRKEKPQQNGEQPFRLSSAFLLVIVLGCLLANAILAACVPGPWYEKARLHAPVISFYFIVLLEGFCRIGSRISRNWKFVLPLVVVMYLVIVYNLQLHLMIEIMSIR